jgi:hypothetical protein
MSYEIPDFYVGILPADVDMSGDTVSPFTPNDLIFQFTAVQVRAALNTPGFGVGGAAVAPPPSSSVPILGILQNNPQLGEAAQVLTEGVSKALLSGTVSINNILMADAPNGNGACPLKLATTGNYGVAQALENGVAGSIIAVYLRSFGKQ